MLNIVLFLPRRKNTAPDWTALDRGDAEFYTARMAERIGLFGGSFNPVHNGHLIAARAIREKLGLGCVLFLPSHRPPHKENKSLAEAKHRAHMVQLAIECEPGFGFDDNDMIRTGPCYTIDTVTHFKSSSPSAEVYWFVGADSLAELPTWHRAVELVSLCTIVTASRSKKPIDWSVLERAFGASGVEKLRSGIVDTPVIDISSTEIRRRVAAGFSIRYLVPETVRDYILKNGIYQAGPC